MDDQLHPLAQVVAVLTAVASGAFSLWCTVIAFTGGRLPLVGVYLEGGVVSGLLWLFIVDPIIVTVCYWVSMAIVVPIAAALSRKERR